MKKHKKKRHNLPTYPNIMKNYGWRGGGLDLLAMDDEIYPKHHSDRQYRYSGGYVDPNSVDVGYDFSKIAERAGQGAGGFMINPLVGLVTTVAGAGIGAIEAGINQSNAYDDRDLVNANNSIFNYMGNKPSMSGYSGSGDSGATVYSAYGGRIARAGGGATNPDDPPPRNKSIYRLGNPDAGQTLYY